eukprot:CAMPEP_0184490082 /NCGR_PEP_ID=MMETSP0113_2-20130426/17099_1 /TAXON_ID=91329 /ORGANISM="Norrisiella sphaerica, Strain BC52" /LENGTH=200 /DNA_ID=CAMNT_0026873823 /DNA_START=184 /DNA_END=786 /DNA_ORIENTATION=-
MALRCASSSGSSSPSQNVRDVMVITLEDVLMPREGSTVFKGIHYALSGCGMPYYVISSGSRADASKKLLSQDGLFEDFTADSRRLLAEKDPIASLTDIVERTPKSVKLHFINSDPKVLEKASQAFPGTNLYLASWSEASALPIDIENSDSSTLPYQKIGLAEFVELAKMGIIMAYGIDSHRQFALNELYRDPASASSSSS